MPKRQERLTKDQYRVIITRFRKQGCSLCPEKEICCLTADHLDPSEKLFNIGASITRHTKEELLAELAKCRCVCLNCHAKLNAGLI